MKLFRRRFLHLLAGAAALATVSQTARAQAYPTRPIRLVIPYPPCGVVDAVGRPWADKMKSLFGTVVVENIGGGGGETWSMKQTGGNADGDALVAAMKGMSWESPRGPISIDADTRDIVCNIYIRRVEKLNGQLWNTEFETFPSVKDPMKA